MGTAPHASRSRSALAGAAGVGAGGFLLGVVAAATALVILRSPEPPAPGERIQITSDPQVRAQAEQIARDAVDAELTRFAAEARRLAESELARVAAAGRSLQQDVTLAERDQAPASAYAAPEPQIRAVSLLEPADPTEPDGTLRIRVNRAEPAELELLPGIGPALAGRIIESRRLDGPFRSLADLQRVRGIGPRTAESLDGLVAFD
ncbi:MAG: helix-hairpin-helix domain-containing protein [Planctomycetota bacterium]